MIDLKALRTNPDHFRLGCRRKHADVDIDAVLALDSQYREARTRLDRLRAEQNKLSKQTGPLIGKLSGQLKAAQDNDRDALLAEIESIKAKPAALKAEIASLESGTRELEATLSAQLLTIPQPADADVPEGTCADDNVEIRRWSPNGFDVDKPFAEQRGFAPKTHLELIERLGMADFERGVKLAGSRSYLLTGDGALLHMAVLRYAMDFVVSRGFTPVTVPVLVREEAMIGTGFFPASRDQAYHVPESQRRATDSESSQAGSNTGYDLFLTGTGEVSLMGMHADEILDEADLPLKLCTLSTCFRREAGAAGRDTAGLYRIHQFDKVEQVVICRADEAESRRWHQEMIGIVAALLESLELPHRLLQCCAGDLGAKNADMIDLECWMPSRGENGPDGAPTGAFGETHSASRLYDYQCRRLNMRYRPGGAGGKGETVFCHSLNNTVAASPRLLIPLLEIHQQEDGSIAIPKLLQPYLAGRTSLG